MALFQDRLSQLQPTNPQKQPRLVKDLPANTQLMAIQQILGGQKSFGPEVDSAVKRLSIGGRTPEQIRQAFIEEQNRSPNPLAILGL